MQQTDTIPADQTAPEPAQGETEPDFWAVQSLSGMHIGLWSQEGYAKDAFAEYPGGKVIPLYLSPSPRERELETEVERLRTATENAYGILWRDTHRGSAEKSIAARKTLFSAIDKDGQRQGIAHAISIYGETTEAESIAGAEQQDELESTNSVLTALRASHAETTARLEALEEAARKSDVALREARAHLQNGGAHPDNPTMRWITDAQNAVRAALATRPEAAEGQGHVAGAVKTVVCIACEGVPVAPNDPCELCGTASALASPVHVPEGAALASAGEVEAAQIIQAFINQEVDYMTLNKLGDPEKQHNVKWGRNWLAALHSKTREGMVLAHEDYVTHHNDWRSACVLAKTVAKDDPANQAYWQHQIDTLDRIAAPTPAGPSEFAWVIERGDSDPATPTYWTGHDAWSQDHMDAVRFARQIDAVNVAKREQPIWGLGHRVAEHGWSSPLAAAPTPDERPAAPAEREGK